MSNCCGGGCGASYKSEPLDMRLTLDLVKEAGILSKTELNELHKAVDAYEEMYGEK